MTPEGLVKKAVKKILDDAGVYYFMPAANGFGRAGIPDIICCVDGSFVAFELKAGNGKTTALQDREIADILKNGGYATVINETNLDKVKEVIEWMQKNSTLLER